ncbi:MAG: helix-turn-helix domain-containing protein [Chthoniobacteraceae bacterium]
MNNSNALLDTLIESGIYRDYERAFSEATGLPLALRPAEAWQPPFRGKPRENSFCALMAAKSASCAGCLRMQERMSEAAADGPAMEKCHFGLTEAAVPVKLGENTLGFLATGQVFTQKPGAEQFEGAMKTLKRMGLAVDRAEARKSFMATRVMSRSQLASATRLLEIFADHLSMKVNQLAVRRANAEPIAVIRAKDFIRQNLQNDITLGDVAKAACTSTFYICKLFKRHTGVNFTEYVSRLRVGRAKELLANPSLRISEIAYEVGFQSLTHFNRIFRKMEGQAPTAYRESIALALAA